MMMHTTEGLYFSQPNVPQDSPDRSEVDWKEEPFLSGASDPPQGLQLTSYASRPGHSLDYQGGCQVDTYPLSWSTSSNNLYHGEHWQRNNMTLLSNDDVSIPPNDERVHAHAHYPIHAPLHRLTFVGGSTPFNISSGGQEIDPSFATENVSALAGKSDSPLPDTELQGKVAKDAVIEAASRRRRNEAKFTCDIPGCGQTFTAQHNLKNHRNSHYDLRQYDCHFKCGKSFITDSDRKRHERRCAERGSCL